ncbi:hypothetical protein I542_5556 [Mycobacteroides abscessus 1948]|uniref:Uncharacterized protein n=1 Tax=Mycobacteroides abscessus 1948 TaxID=1299323 RepID=A0A829QS14_9MYCO|nr:hypothetical protein I542_5556 [Mycobacteroides abscessus 1948]
MLAKAVDADPRDIQSTFVGALCRWQAMSKSGGLVDITRFWFETGSLEAEKATANSLKYNVQERAIQGIPSIVMKPPDQPARVELPAMPQVLLDGGSTRRAEAETHARRQSN